MILMNESSLQWQIGLLHNHKSLSSNFIVQFWAILWQTSKSSQVQIETLRQRLNRPNYYISVRMEINANPKFAKSLALHIRIIRIRIIVIILDS